MSTTEAPETTEAPDVVEAPETEAPEAETGTALAPYNAAAGLAYVDALGAHAGLVGLELDNPTALTYDQWVDIGKQLCQVGDSWQWWVGDWLNFGEGLFGEDQAAAAVDDKQTRYDVARRVTGLEQGYLQNIRWVAASVAKTRRKPELKFSHHIEVAKLDPPEQTRWLKKAIKETWNTRELRDAIKAAKNAALGAGEPTDDPPPPDVAPTPYERLHDVCRELWGLAANNPDGSWNVPNEPMQKLVELLGE